MKSFIVKIFVIFVALLQLSCIEELVDENVGGVLKPNITGSILYLESTENIINLSGANPVFVQTGTFDGFKSDFFSSRVLSGSLTYEVTNTTSKDLVLLIELLDESDVVLDSESITINADPSTAITRNILYGPPAGKDINIIKNLSSIRTTLTNNSDFTRTSSATDPKLIFKSKGEFILQLIK